MVCIHHCIQTAHLLKLSGHNYYRNINKKEGRADQAVIKSDCRVGALWNSSSEGWEVQPQGTVDLEPLSGSQMVGGTSKLSVAP